MVMKTASEYRALARHRLGGRIFENTWLYAMIVGVIGSVIFSLLSSTVILAFLFEGFYMIGASRIYLKLVRGAGGIDFADLLEAKDRIGDAFVLGLLKNLFTALWTLLFIVPGIIKAYAYSMAYYISSEHPEYDWRRALEESQRIMRGNKWRLFCLDLSFLGWWIVGALCFGVGVFWAIPYHEVARAAFYEDLKETPVIL